MARYIDADEAEYTVLHLDIEVAKPKCKDYESYINGAEQFRHQIKVGLRHLPTADVMEVVHCNDCAQHGTCIFEDTFNTTGLAYEYRFCGVGKRK